ncbi:hypothetical protein MASR1M45_07040 [Candidatus Kapaibacterium sp.]
MKKIILFLLIFLITDGLSQRNELSLAIRNIKLGNTYREGKDFDNAAKFISEGMKQTRKFKGFDAMYWTAVGHESLGYLYRDMSMFDESQNNFKQALEIYKKIIRQEDGSQYAMIDVLNKIAGLSNDETAAKAGNIGTNDNTVSLVGRKLKSLPQSLPSGLKSLILKNNRFRQFPDELTTFKKIEYLDLSENRIRDLSNSIGVLKNLHYLDLSNNKIQELPPSVINLQSLKELNLEGNKLKSLNYNLCGLKNLEILNLRNNKLNFQEVLRIIKCLPNTNIIFDKYEKVEDENEEEAE